MSWCVYRLLDRDGGVLYVGSTGRLWARLGAHAEDKPWWSQVERVVADGPFDSPDEARRAEQVAIDEYRPTHNQFRAHGKTPLRGFRIPEEEYAAAREMAIANGETLTSVLRAGLREYVQETEQRRALA